MSIASIATLLATAVAGLVAWRQGGVVGQGVLGGALLGGAVAGFGIAWMRHVQRVRPARLMTASLAVSLAKLGGLCSAWLVLRFVPAAGALADWQSFLVAYAAVALVATLAGAVEVHHVLKTTLLERAALESRTREGRSQSGRKDGAPAPRTEVPAR